MAETENRPNAADVQHQSGTELAPCATPSASSRPRLGAAEDSWATVFKDVLREAPKTCLIVIGMLVIAAINAITYLCFMLADRATPPPDGLLFGLLHDLVDDLLSK